MSEGRTPSEARRWTRRDWLRAGAIAGIAGVAGAAAGAELIAPLLAPPTPATGELRDDFVYTKFSSSQWWDNLVGQPARVTDFQEWQGASAVWRGLFREGNWVPGTGLPVLIIRIIRDDTYFHPPDSAPYGLPPDYSLYYDDLARNLRVVVLYDRCTHLCCYPGWHVVTNPPPLRDYAAYGTAPPTYLAYNQDPVYCVCHGAQYDPLLLTADVNPKNGAPFVGARIVHGPGAFALPVIPVRGVDDVLYGSMSDPRWYAFC